MPQTVTSAPALLPRLCTGCGRPLEGKRPQAKAHDAACRQRAYRRRKKDARRATAPVAAGLHGDPHPLRLAESPAH